MNCKNFGRFTERNSKNCKTISLWEFIRLRANILTEMAMVTQYFIIAYYKKKV